jgi:DMSO/TMAO reductase YedYZ molybdopterin-dependent catalytic subunit
MSAEPETSAGISLEELQLAARNHGMPLEALRHEITPIGLHYLLVHYDIPVVDPATWRLTIGGLVATELELTLDDLKARDAVTAAITMECAGNGRALLEPRPVSQPWLSGAVGTAEWTGVALAPLLEDAGVRDDALEVVFTGLDRGVEGGIEQVYERSLTVADAQRDDVLLAYACNGRPLPPQHGFPLRLIVPGWYGMTSVKWLHRIALVDEPFTGYQMVTGYRMRADEDDPGTPITRIEPRSLLVPPGIPDFMTRRRFLPAGSTRLEGRAWSGWGPIEGVEVSTDGGATWSPAQVGDPPGPAAWAPFAFDWDAPEGEHVLCARTRDVTGRSQPDAPPWNVGGYSNNALQRILVTVRA